MSGLWPFWSYFGGKWRAAPHYPAPEQGLIVEPFAGAAGYSLRYPHLEVILVEKDPILAALWRYILGATENEILSLPDVPLDGSVDDLSVPLEAKHLIGFWLNKGTVSPCRVPSTWMKARNRPKSFWGPEIRTRIARQLEYVRHWGILETGYENAPDVSATWFIDPPYMEAGRRYRHGAKHINFSDLADFCRTRRGQVIVCENSGAKWLPFEHFRSIKSLEGSRGKNRSEEAVWLNTPEFGL